MSNNKTSKLAVDANKYPASASRMKVNMVENEEGMDEYDQYDMVDECGVCVYCQTSTKYIDAMGRSLMLQDTLAQELCTLQDMADSALNLCSEIEGEAFSKS